MPDRFLFFLAAGLDVENLDDYGFIGQIESPSYYILGLIWQYFTVSNSPEAKKGGAKNDVCKFCVEIFSGCCTTRATATFWGVLCWAKLKLEYGHILQSTKKLMTEEQ